MARGKNKHKKFRYLGEILGTEVEFPYCLQRSDTVFRLKRAPSLRTMQYAEEQSMAQDDGDITEKVEKPIMFILDQCSQISDFMPDAEPATDRDAKHEILKKFWPDDITELLMAVMHGKDKALEAFQAIKTAVADKHKEEDAKNS